MTDRERLLDLINQALLIMKPNFTFEAFADFLLANGVVAIDTNVISTENRPLIQTLADMPINDVLDLIKAKEEGRIIVPPCKPGDTAYCVRTWPSGRKTIHKFEAPDWDWIIEHLNDFGKNIFLTREEAERSEKQ